ncbi:unnamed protein product [Arctogadus glacialis]
MSACSCCLWPSSAWVRTLRGHGGWIREMLECGRVKVVSERGLGPSDEPGQHHVTSNGLEIDPGPGGKSPQTSKGLEIDPGPGATSPQTSNGLDIDPGATSSLTLALYSAWRWFSWKGVLNSNPTFYVIIPV